QYDNRFEQLKERCEWWISVLRVFSHEKDSVIMLYLKRVQETMDTSEVEMQDIMEIAKEQIVDIDKKIKEVMIESRRLEKILNLDIPKRSTELKELENLKVCLQMNQDLGEELLVETFTEFEVLESTAASEGNVEMQNKIKSILEVLDKFIFVAEEMGAVLEEIFEIELEENDDRLDFD
ncbi:hypothetical protein P4679_33175, partial [Priestia megaterium]|uniref:hypothetical protein n=1 Tax=Priestia megaterium TaxID=1404 RepID=UPI002E1AF9BA|nr:hypothetical protein [Priestia megaterium]